MVRGKRLSMGFASCAVLMLAVVARAADQPISAIKLILKIAPTGKEKFIFVSKDPGFLFPAINGSNDPANGTPGGVIVEILTANAGDATFNVPPGESLPPGWKVKDGTIDLYKYVNKDAPAGPVPIKVVVLKDTKVLKVVGKETGVALDGTLGDVVIRITTGTDRNCARFDASTIKKDEVGQFVALGAVASSLSDCGSGPPTTVTSTTTSISTSSSSSSTSTSSTSSSSSSSTSTTSTSTTSTSSTSTSATTSTSTSITTSTSTSTSSTTSTSTSITTSTSNSTTTSTSSSTTTSLPRVLRFTTAVAGGTCGAVKSGGAAGSTRKSLTCGGLNIGGGQSTVAEGPTPAGANTFMTATGGGPTLTISARTSAQTGSINTCSAASCRFGPWLPIKSAGTSTCVRNTFLAPGATGTVNTTTGALSGSFPLNSDVYLTGNGTSPCPKCILVTGTFRCDPGWTASTGNPYPDRSKVCTAVNTAGDTYDCAPPAQAFLGPITVTLNPITTGTASFSNAGGIFCPSQGNTGAFGCAGDGTAANAICPGGNAPPLIDYIEEIGTPAGPLSSTPASGTLASVFCIPTVGGALGFLVNSAGNLPGPGATTLPGTLTLLP